eukprot:XP_011433191.1 PREDICTED: uncharacterized protein LOC105332332 [Crassostrea gigas]
MKSFNIVCLGLSFILYLTSHLADACSCARLPVSKNIVCGSSYAIKAKVLRKERDVIQDGFPGFQQNVFVYTVKIFKDYKNANSYLGTQKIYTGENSAACGVNLKLKEVYLLTGSIRNKKWWIELCGGGYQETSTLSAFQKRALKRGIYQKNCDCQTRYCGDSQGDPKCSAQERNECLVTENSDCFRKNNACVNVNGSCQWLTQACQGSPYNPGK